MSAFWNLEGNDLRIDGVIATKSWWGDEVTPAMFRQDLESVKGNLSVWINSPGGDVIAAADIYSMLKEHKGHVRVVVVFAASAASVIAMAGDEVCIVPTGYLMIHRAWSIAMGNEGDFDAMSKRLREIDQGILQAYKLKTGMDEDEILELMKEETYLNSVSALEKGFVDKILYTEEQEKTKQGRVSAMAELESMLRMPRNGVVYAAARPVEGQPHTIVDAARVRGKRSESDLLGLASDPKPNLPFPEPTQDITDRDRAAFALQMQSALSAFD